MIVRHFPRRFLRDKDEKTELSSNMAPRLSGQSSISGVVFFVSKSLLGIEGQKKLEILIRRPWPPC